MSTAAEKGLDISVKEAKGRVQKTVDIVSKNPRVTSSVRFKLYRDGSLDVTIDDELSGKISADLADIEVLEEVLQHLKDK